MPEDAHLAIQTLRRVPYFADLDDETLEEVARIAVRREYEAGEVVFCEGESCTGLHLVEKGWLKIVKLSPEGREQSLRIVGPGELFGEMGVFSCGLNPATVIALDRTVLWVICREAMHRLLEAHPRMAWSILQSVARRVTELVGLIEDLSLRTVEARLARYILRYAEGDRLRRQRWATQAEMAARLGTVLHVLNRALHTLEAEGLIAVDRQEIRILDAEGLRAKARLYE